ncbi:MAG: T9SS type A sorting domain-containing protein [Saprospiraceae bacterium]|nr:T9SS type A sorting domain-containing protein [Saprospiraceae bacterium]
MKKSPLFILLLLLSTGLFAQKKTFPNAEKNAPTFDPAPHLDLTPPVVTCLNGLSVNIMPTGMIQLWASDFLLSVSDNVTPTDQIKIGLRKCGTGAGFPLDANGNPVLELVFNCEEIGTKCIELWARDAAGNANYCETYVLVQDNLSNCSEVGGGNIRVCSTRTFCDSTGGVEELTYEITTQLPSEPPITYFDTNNENCFDQAFPLGINVEIAPMKDDNPLNGVTTYDLVLLSKHIHGIQPFTEPWQWVAADVNRDGQITLEDSIDIRNLILGIYTDFPNNTSWRFVLEGYQFPAPDPLSQSFPESFALTDLQDTSVNVRFWGIKIGDLNCTAVANGTSPVIDERTVHQENPTLGLPRPNPSVGDAILPIYLPRAENLRLEISDLTGKLLWVNEVQLEQGNHNLEIPASAMSGKGVYVWRVWAGAVVKTGKLVRI